MSPFQDSRQRGQLASALKRLRLAAGLTGYQVAEQLGLDQSTVSRIERNQQRISIAQVDLWCKATGTSDERRGELLTLAEEALVGPQSWDEAAESGSTNFQRETKEMEAKAGKLSFYQPAMLPGLLTTATYARRIFSSGPAGVPQDIAERVLGRMERQHILYDDQKTLKFVVPEAVLRWPVGPVNEHLEQLSRLGEILVRPNVDLRILPMAPTLVWRADGFVLYEDIEESEPFVHLELLTRPLNIEEPEQVDFYRKVFANLLDASLSGDDARDLLNRAIEDMRG